MLPKRDASLSPSIKLWYLPRRNKPQQKNITHYSLQLQTLNTMATLSAEFVLTPSEEEALKESSLIKDVLSTLGKRKVSVAFLSPPSSISSTSSFASSVASVTFKGEAVIQKVLNGHYVISLPKTLESVEGIEFLGFTFNDAKEILDRFEARPNPRTNPSSLLSYVLAELGKLDLPGLRDLPAEAAMIHLGISDELRAILLKQEYKQIFASQTVRFWLNDTIITRHTCLVQLLDRIKIEAGKTLITKKGKKRPKLTSESFKPQSDTAGPSQSTSNPTATITFLEINDDTFPNAHVVIAAMAPTLPDHTTLYKGKSSVELVGGNPDAPLASLILPDGSVNMRSLSTYEGGDFNQSNVAWYWTPEEATAEMYRKWAAARCAYAPSWLISIQVPNSFLNGLRTSQLWYSPDWKEYIWYCKGGLSKGFPPDKFDHLWKPGKAQLVKGHICGGPPQRIPRIKKENVQTSISDADVMRVQDADGADTHDKATQWVMMHQSDADPMGNLCKGKIHIAHHPAETLLSTGLETLNISK
jgi:hypothetical protein